MVLEAIDSGCELFVITHVSPKPQSGSTRVLNLEIGQIQFGFTAGEKSNARSGGCETQRQPFPDAASRSGYEDDFSLQVAQTTRLASASTIHSGRSRSAPLHCRKICAARRFSTFSKALRPTRTNSSYISTAIAPEATRIRMWRALRGGFSRGPPQAWSSPPALGCFVVEK